jgi:hypothetical protein
VKIDKAVVAGCNSVEKLLFFLKTGAKDDEAYTAQELVTILGIRLSTARHLFSNHHERLVEFSAIANHKRYYGNRRALKQFIELVGGKQ